MTPALPFRHSGAMVAMGVCALASALFFVSPSFLPKLPAVAFSFFDALPLLVCGLVYGWIYGLGAGLLGALGVAVAQSAGLALPDVPTAHGSVLFFVENTVPAAFFVHLAYTIPQYLRGGGSPLNLPAPIVMQGAVTGSLTLYAMVLAVVMTSLLDAGAVQAILEQTLQAVGDADPKTMKILQQAWGPDVAAQLAAAVPGLSALGWLVGFCVNAVVAVRVWSKITRTSPPLMKMGWFRLPRWLVGVVFALGLVLMLHTRDVLALPQDVFSLLNNILLVALAGFFFNGAGVFHRMAEKRRFLIPLFYAAFLFIPLLIYVVAMVGLMDPIVSMRRDVYPTEKG
jgi:hypothetical protein